MNISFLYVAQSEDTGIPIGLSYLIALAKQDNDVSLFETTFRYYDVEDEFRKFIKINKPDILGIHTTSLCQHKALSLVSGLKDRPVTVWGGVGPTVDSEHLMTLPEVDHVCVGPGEQYLMDFLGSPWDGEMPMPDWSLFDGKHFSRIFKGEVKRWGNFQLSRGCFHSCSYCVNAFYHKMGLHPKRFRPERIVDEICNLADEYSLDIIRIFDECFGWHIKDTEQFAKLYHNRVGLPTIVETRPETITPKMIELLKLMNCVSVSLGIECGNEHQRKILLNRHIRNETIIDAFDMLHEAGIRSASYNIVGWPNDTEELIQETVDLNKRCNPDFDNWFLASPFPGTRLREYCIEQNLLETEIPADYGRESIIKNPNISKDRLMELFGTVSLNWRKAMGEA